MVHGESAPARCSVSRTEVKRQSAIAAPKKTPRTHRRPKYLRDMFLSDERAATACYSNAHGRGDLLLQILRRRGDARDGRERLNNRRFFEHDKALDDDIALLAAAHERQHHRVGERRQRHEGHA